nr:hypothetical protein [Tanacetum cinerariifolium]
RLPHHPGARRACSLSRAVPVGADDDRFQGIRRDGPRPCRRPPGTTRDDGGAAAARGGGTGSGRLMKWIVALV